MDDWISGWLQGRLLGCQKKWLWGLVAALLLFGGISWGTSSFIWRQVTIEVDGEEIVTRTFAADVARLLEENKISLLPEDKVTPSLDASLTKNMNIKIERAVAVTIEVDGREKEILVSPLSTVRDTLNKSKTHINREDQITPAMDCIVTAGDRIKVVRVTSETVKEQEEINYRTERRANNKTEKGINQTIQKGQKGLKEKTYRVVYEDGQEVKRELVSAKVLKEPVPEIISTGALSVAFRGGQNFRFERVFTATATAYTHTGNRTKTGVWPQVGTVAVDPNTIALGTRVYVEGYGFGIAQDIGSAIKGNRIDVFVDSQAEAARWGVRKVKVYILS